MKYICITIITILIFFSAYGQTANVYYGERNLARDSTCLYFDKDGTLYPSYHIPDSILEHSNASLNEAYRNNENLFLEISKKYSCDFIRFNDKNCSVLNDSIIKSSIKFLNENDYTGISFFIHGFRKPFKPADGAFDSPSDFNTLTGTFANFNNSNSKLIEVYWDALYGCCFSANSKKNKPLFQLFEIAQKNAEKTGNALKKIITNVSKDTINIISHSLGARVAIYSILNIPDSNSFTPQGKRVNICLIAPAISAELIRCNYLNRNPRVTREKKDNYSLYIVYNNKDFVLKKRDNRIGLLGPGPYKYGNTTLGCNYRNAAIHLRSCFNSFFPGSSIKLYNLSHVKKCHYVSCYCNADNMKETFSDMQK